MPWTTPASWTPRWSTRETRRISTACTASRPARCCGASRRRHLCGPPVRHRPPDRRRPERERMAHVSVDYWSIDVQVQTDAGSFAARVAAADGGRQPIASGSDFGEDGKPARVRRRARSTGEARAKAIAAAMEAFGEARPSSSPSPRSPTAASPPPHDVDLQQEASRKSCTGTRAVHDAHRPVAVRGRLHHHMRTDSTALSTQAVNAARPRPRAVRSRDRPAKPRHYGKVAKGAQEAHEPGSPATTSARRTRSGALSRQQLALYDLIWAHGRQPDGGRHRPHGHHPRRHRARPGRASTAWAADVQAAGASVVHPRRPAIITFRASPGLRGGRDKSSTGGRRGRRRGSRRGRRSSGRRREDPARRP